MNKQLRRISQLASIDKKVSFHTARHTNATLLLYNGANITTVQKLLGHKSVRTTEIYSNIMDMTIVRDLEKIETPFFGITFFNEIHPPTKQVGRKRRNRHRTPRRLSGCSIRCRYRMVNV